MKKLSDDRLESFNTDFVHNHVGWERMENMIESNFPSGNFSFLDIGGGNGAFADRLLDKYPKAHGTVIDNAKYLLNKNIPHKRKKLAECSVENMYDQFKDDRFDLINFNWVLHHFVENSYKRSIHSISNALRSARKLLSDNGLVSILENCYLPYINESLPSKIIYHSVSSKTLSLFTKWLGANTSGTGVCYLSKNLWCSMLNAVGLRVLTSERTGSLKTNQIKNYFCFIRGIDVVHIVAN